MSVSHDHIGTRHSALVYGEPAEFVDGVGGFARAGLREGDQVLAVATPDKLAWLREDLGGDADAVELVDAGEFYEHHGQMFRALLGKLERHATHGRGRMRIVAEQALARRRPPDVRAYMRFEAASNIAYERYDVSVLCPYDAARLPDEVVRAALETHPHVLEDDRARPSDSFVDPRSFIRRRVRETPAPDGAATHVLERPTDVAGARALIRDHGAAVGLSRRTIEDVSLAVTEVATNALIHGGAPRRLWTYVADEHLVCQVHDAGSGLPDPLAGYLPPEADRPSGRGLWLAHQLCDIVEIVSDDTRTNVFLHTRLPTGDQS
jgi:anti-sigma regulatory factor (Ser/Thr protein kinase)